MVHQETNGAQQETGGSGHALPPPLLFLVPLAVGLLLHRRVPLPFLPPGLGRWTGVRLVLGGAALIVWAVWAMRRAGTSPNPNEPDTALVTNGPFRLSRNPIYVSYAMVHLGIAALVNSLWAALMLPVALALTRRLAIDREERGLEEQFGRAYLDYKAWAPRWL